ncbi:MAG: hypothetical protein ACYCO3_16990 [Mycobacteriales bacterium]
MTDTLGVEVVSHAHVARRRSRVAVGSQSGHALITVWYAGSSQAGARRRSRAAPGRQAGVRPEPGAGRPETPPAGYGGARPADGLLLRPAAAKIDNYHQKFTAGFTTEPSARRGEPGGELGVDPGGH